jgi:hypothetical protein
MSSETGDRVAGPIQRAGVDLVCNLGEPGALAREFPES